MAYSYETLAAIWQKASYTGLDNEANGFRKDQCTAWIRWADYGNRYSDYGWEVDHITAREYGGGEELSNLRPLHWKNNLAKGGGRLVCVVKSIGDRNTGL